MSIILSISRGHNASTTLMVDDEVVFYVEEERLSRFKHDGAPLAGLIKAFDYVDHIDHLVICHTHRHASKLDWTGENVYHGLIRKIAKKKFEFNTHFFDLTHHKIHAACAFFNSGFETAACVVADGAGSFLQIRDLTEPCYEFETIFKASYPLRFETVYKHLGTSLPVGVERMYPESTNIDELEYVIPYRDKDGIDISEQYLTEHPGLTKVYEAVTKYCCFDTIDAGKTMGLSPYGKDNPDLPDLFNGKWTNREVVLPTYPGGAKINSGRYKILEEDVQKHKPHVWTQVQKDMAWKCQRQTEERMIELIQKAHEQTGETNIVVSGGYGLNCVANYKYWKAFPNLNILAEPISHDGGTSLGGAKYLYNKLKNKQSKPVKNWASNNVYIDNNEVINNIEIMSPQTSIYYGPKYDPNSYLDELDGYTVTDTSYDDIAKLIREGNIVTIFQGRSEGGPRALGNRSILFDPTIKDGKDIVNGVKNREFFRPFACSILKEKVHDWFDLAGREESPHMMYAVDALPGIAEKIPSVIHVDNTCRIQTVTKEQNEHYYNLISAFEKLSDTPILFNTSFNLGGDPLVEDLYDAIKTLQTSDIDWMYLPEIQKLVYIPRDGKHKESNWFQMDENGRTFTTGNVTNQIGDNVTINL